MHLYFFSLDRPMSAGHGTLLKLTWPVGRASTMPAQPDARSLPSVLVLGCGVVGLSCAHELASAGYKVKIVARDLPEDLYSAAFSSPWAGANFCPFKDPKDNPQICQFEAATFPRLKKLIEQGLAIPLNGTRRFAKTEKDLLSHWYKDIVDNVRMSSFVRGRAG